MVLVTTMPKKRASKGKGNEATRRARALLKKPSMHAEGVFFQMRIRRSDSDNLKWWAKERGFKSVAAMFRALAAADYAAHAKDHGKPPHVHKPDPRQLVIPETE